MVFVPKYRYKILEGDLGRYVYQSIYGCNNLGKGRLSSN
ncbi:hypothetical protein [Bathymodiolus platifrons methanotrophic gill symbiont]